MQGKQLPDLCSCGRFLYECLDESGKRIGVTHTPEDEDHHFQFWSTEETAKRLFGN